MALTVEQKISAIETLIRVVESGQAPEARAIHERAFDAMPREAREYAAYNFKHGLENLSYDYFDEDRARRDETSYTFALKRQKDDRDAYRGRLTFIRQTVELVRKDVEHEILCANAGVGTTLHGTGVFPKEGFRVKKVNARTSFTIEYETTTGSYGRTLPNPVTETKMVTWSDYLQGRGWRTRGELALDAERLADVAARVRKVMADKGIEMPKEVDEALVSAKIIPKPEEAAHV